MNIVDKINIQKLYRIKPINQTWLQYVGDRYMVPINRNQIYEQGDRTRPPNAFTEVLDSLLEAMIQEGSYDSLPDNVGTLEIVTKCGENIKELVSIIDGITISPWSSKHEAFQRYDLCYNGLSHFRFRCNPEGGISCQDASEIIFA